MTETIIKTDFRSGDIIYKRKKIYKQIRRNISIGYLENGIIEIIVDDMNCIWFFINGEFCDNMIIFIFATIASSIRQCAIEGGLIGCPIVLDCNMLYDVKPILNVKG